MEKQYIQRRIDLLMEEGIEFKFNVNAGVDISKEELEKNYYSQDPELRDILGPFLES